MSVVKCGFCHQGEEAAECGSLHTGEVGGKPVVAHHKCMQYSAGLRQYRSDKFGGFKIDKVKKEISRASRLPCSLCRKKGASGGCAWASCKKGYHFPCAHNNAQTVTKRYKVASGDVTVVMYRVFCSKQHENVYRQNMKSGSLGLGDLHAEKSSGSSNKDSKQANTEKKTAKDDEQSEEGQGHTENDSDTNDYDPKLAQESDEHDVSMRSVEGNEAVSSSHESPGLTEKEVIEETKKEFLKLKEKRKAEDNNRTREKKFRSAYSNKNNNRSQSPSLLSPPVMKTRHSPRGNKSDLPTSQTNGYDLSHNLSPEASDVEKSDDETIGDDDDDSNMDKEEVVLLVPSSLGVPDSELEEIYKELEITPDQSVVWPPSNRTGSLQDKHLPLLMWNLVEGFRNEDFQKITTILRNPSGLEYDCFVNYHTEQDDTQNDSLVKQVFHNIAEKLMTLNGKLSGTGKCGQLMSRKYQMMKVLVLYLSTEFLNHRRVVSCLRGNSLFMWSRDTTMRDRIGTPQKTQQEVSLLWKWLKTRLKSGFQIDSCPVEEVFINEKHCTEVVGKLVDKLSVHPRCSSFSSNTSTTVLAINSANRDVVRYDCFVRRVVERLAETSMCKNMYFIVGLHKGDNINSVRDLLPLHLIDDAEVYTAFDPDESSVSCILLYVKKEVSSVESVAARRPSPVIHRQSPRGRKTTSSSGTPIVLMSPL